MLGGHDSEGQPKFSPILAIGPVKKRGKDLPSMCNHADYVGSRGYYDLTQFMIDHKRELPSLSNTFLGKLAPYATSESDCESLFSESGHLAKSHMNRTNVETFKRMCLAKHRIARIYCDKEKVKTEFLRRIVMMSNSGTRKWAFTLMNFLNTRESSKELRLMRVGQGLRGRKKHPWEVYCA